MADKKATTSKTKVKPKKLTVKQVEALKAGHITCFETKCLKKTCGKESSVDHCNGKERRSFEIASGGTMVSAAGKDVG